MKRLCVGMKVYDTWWPFRIGIIRAVTPTRIKVRFLSGGPQETVEYDKAHSKRFLREYTQPNP